MNDEMNEMIGKKVYIRTNSQRIYNGRVVAIENNFIKIIDKYNMKVIISISDLEVLEEVGG